MPQAADVLDLATARLAGAPMTDGAVWGLGRAALRTAAPALLDVLALRATRGRWRAAEVAQSLQRVRDVGTVRQAGDSRDAV